MMWISQTLSTFTQLPPTYADPRTIELELSRLRVRVINVCMLHVDAFGVFLFYLIIYLIC